MKKRARKKHKKPARLPENPISEKEAAWWTYAGRFLVGENHPYWSALGIFVHAFSQTERMLSILLTKRASVSEYVSNAVFSGVRIDSAMDYIRRIAEAKTHVRDIGKTLEGAFVQLKVITKVRNDILHFGTMEDFDRGIVWVSNEGSALTPKHVRAYVMSVENLRQMTDDLLKIQFIILCELAPTFAEQVPQTLARAWQYKSQPTDPRTTLWPLAPRRRVRKPKRQDRP